MSSLPISDKDGGRNEVEAMSTISHEIYDLLRTYQREMNQREPLERKRAAKEREPSFGKLLENMAGAAPVGETASPVNSMEPSANDAGRSSQQEKSSNLLKSLNYDPTGYLRSNSKERQSIIDFFQ